MIFHLSVAAQNPRHAAEVIAELWRGRAFAFPPFPESWIAFAGDDRGSAVEVYPLGRELVPGDKAVAMRAGPPASTGTATHLAIATPLSEDEVKAIAAREGWRALVCDRGGLFHVVEFWVENRLLVEVLTPEMQREYLASMSPANWQSMLEAGAAA